MTNAPVRLTACELAGRVDWMSHRLEDARLEGRAICAAERAVMDKYVAGEITSDELRLEILRLFENPGVF